MVGAVDYAVTPIATILDKPIFLPQSNMFSKTIIWSGVRREKNIGIEDIISKSIYLSSRHHKNVLMILNFELKKRNGDPVKEIMLTKDFRLKKVRSFEGDVIQKDEQYHLYDVHRI
ncbi:hypothetical protein EG833_05180 [archaeon]|nr:hypothetical protein [archaeon]